MTDIALSAGMPRLTSGIAGLDALFGGGLPQRRTLLLAGDIGTGKTTLANQIAFHHARTGDSVIVTSLLAESHDVLIDNLRGFAFFDDHLIGGAIQYLSVLPALLEGGLDAVLDTFRREIRRANASLLVIDGTAIIEDMVTPKLDLRQFAHRLESLCTLLGCTVILITSYLGTSLQLLGGSVNGVILLSHETYGSRRLRLLDIIKMRGISYATGKHEFSISRNGVTVFPRLECLVGHERPSQEMTHGLGTGIEKVDTMLGGGILPLSTTVVTGTPGIGKTLLGLSFIVEGALHGERGLIIGFHEREGDLAATSSGIGRDLRTYLKDGSVKVLWNPPLELSADAWAWQVLAAVQEHGSKRIFIDSLTDVQRVMTSPERLPSFVTALSNELKRLGTTVLISAEIESYTDTAFAMPVPAASASMDVGLLMRHVEVNGRLRRMFSILKVRQSASDPVIQEFEITSQGIVVTQPFKATSGTLTGRAGPGNSE